MTQLKNFEIKKIDGTTQTTDSLKGKVLLIVNVASKCGLTPQYDGLEKIYEQYREKGLVVMGFPANEFLGQEPGSNSEIHEFCRLNYGVQFPMYEKVVVKGEGQHPLFKFLTDAVPTATKKPDGQFEEKLRSKGLLNGQPSDIMWNFEKFLIGREGQIAGRFAPDIEPTNPILISAIEKVL